MPRRGSGKGVRVHAKGYLEIIRRGPWRGWLVHRKVMYEACLEFCYYHINRRLPEGFTVEHLDHDRQHNCIENLLLLNKRIHDHISWETWQSQARAREKQRLEESVPDWVTGDGF